MKVQAEKHIISLFRSWSGKEPSGLQPVAASGSPRKYYRIFFDDTSVMAAYNPDHGENEAFISFTRHFRSVGLPVPDILAADPAGGTYLLTDLGSTSLFDLVIGRKDPGKISPDLYDHLAASIRKLPHFQLTGGKELDYTRCYPREIFDEQSMLWDLNYFKYYILKTSGITFNEDLLERDFRKFASFLSQAGMENFMYRDFQSRNVMLVDGRPWFIDYQGGRKGPLQYDLASFLYQVRAAYPDEIKQRLIDEYLDELEKLGGPGRDVFMKYFHPFVYLRLFQVLGAYGFRGLFEKRPHFAESLKPAMASLAHLLNSDPLDPELTELQSALRKLLQSSRYDPARSHGPELTVNINSFSYKKGLPGDESGHGGGFIFDCRSLPNPGRLEEFKALSGRNQEVKNYLASHREVDTFLYNIIEICDSAIDNYIERGFEHLSISFGCTGGQHRSVYCADRLAEHLSGKYVVKIKLNHLEQKITESIYPSHE